MCGGNNIKLEDWKLDILSELKAISDGISEANTRERYLRKAIKVLFEKLQDTNT